MWSVGLHVMVVEGGGGVYVVGVEVWGICDGSGGW